MTTNKPEKKRYTVLEAYHLGSKHRQPDVTPWAWMPREISDGSVRAQNAYTRGWYDADYDAAPHDMDN